MKILSILAHPRRDSFSHAMAAVAHSVLIRMGHQLMHHDLYEESFDPVLKAEEAFTVGDTVEDVMLKVTDPIIRTHRKEIVNSDCLLVIHPNWWGKPPAILSGWMDRVLVPGVAYRLEAARGKPDGLLSIKKALVLNTSDTPREREKNVFGDPLQLIWGNCVLPYCGVQQVERYIFGPIVGSSQLEREQWLSRVEEYAKKLTVDE